MKEENPPRKRQYDKKSGTGRGREISKGGAGGKGTWGNNPKDMARKYEKNYDDYYIDAALHPEENENKNEEQENKEEKDNNENKKEENNNNENNENKENKENENEDKNKEKYYKKKNKKKQEKEMDPNDIVKIPENAISVEDYLKNNTLVSKEEKKVERPKESEELKIKENNKSNVIGVSDYEKKKKQRNRKEKKDTKEQKYLDEKIYDNLQIGGNVGDFNKNRRDNRKGKENKFVFNAEEFPEL